MQLIGAPRRPEIDQYAIKFIIGAIAFSLPRIEIALTQPGERQKLVVGGSRTRPTP